MGIYSARGFAFLFVFGKSVCPEKLSNLSRLIAPLGMSVARNFASLANVIECIGQRETDARLVHSEYFLAQKESWFNHSGSEAAKLVEPSPIELTAEEMRAINCIEKAVATCGIDEFCRGMYDVLEVSTTY